MGVLSTQECAMWCRHGRPYVILELIGGVIGSKHRLYPLVRALTIVPHRSRAASQRVFISAFEKI